MMMDMITPKIPFSHLSINERFIWGLCPPTKYMKIGDGHATILTEGVLSGIYVFSDTTEVTALDRKVEYKPRGRYEIALGRPSV